MTGGVIDGHWLSVGLGLGFVSERGRACCSGSAGDFTSCRLNLPVDLALKIKPLEHTGGDLQWVWASLWRVHPSLSLCE